MALKTLSDATIVPSVAVQNGSEGAYVYIVTAGNVAKIRPVTVISVEGNQTILGRGVNPGETVVTEGQFRLEPDAVVRIEGGDSPAPQRP